MLYAYAEYVCLVLANNSIQRHVCAMCRRQRMMQQQLKEHVRQRCFLVDDDTMANNFMMCALNDQFHRIKQTHFDQYVSSSESHRACRLINLL